MDRTDFESEIARASCWSFQPELEGTYALQRGRSMARHMARSSAVCAILMLGAIGFDRSNSVEVFAAAWHWRCLVALFCAGVAVCGLRSRNALQISFAYGAAIISIMAVIEFAGTSAPPAMMENYMLAAIMVFAICLAAVPISFSAGLVTCLSAAILHPTLPLLFGTDSSSFVSDTIIGTAASLTVLLVIRKNEIDRRRRFLETLRYEYAAMELSLVNRELLRISNTDALTGLPNRRYFEAEAARLSAEKERKSVGAILMDVDHFKKYNDSAGHIAGDVCLRTVAQALACKADKEGISIARYGGEEFAAIVPSITALELERVCEELRAAVSRVDLPHPGLPGRSVSISAGLAWWDAFAGDPHLLLEEADRALYEAKAAGRNCVAWAGRVTSNASPSIVPDEVVSGTILSAHPGP
ncbi:MULTISPECIES: GGDEF domain-containing protein [unclassified Bradyrhizobium]|uniref:GGDEF domain-containing protein n=1 Tax=unclassified Bradyrhizobium TaxID=2631580 RepID=UPI0020B3B9A0|nr:MULTISPECIES: GGDEF domain-containing protein [unclassified Bradyrhizobium]MCP3379980.1 GGDEF domain-containing protein [Bradyrhizobium sp. CCGUVB4N]MCP3440819.1 GGDEF domain-containing protein [Bradyrhizobium sp. CCGUVB14]